MCMCVVCARGEEEGNDRGVSNITAPLLHQCQESSYSQEAQWLPAGGEKKADRPRSLDLNQGGSGSGGRGPALMVRAPSLLNPVLKLKAPFKKTKNRKEQRKI